MTQRYEFEREKVTSSPRKFYFIKICAILFCVGFCFLGSAAKASAATYYVSQSTANGWVVGNNGNNGTATSTPKLTIGGAISVANSGDTVIVNDGTYSESKDFITKGITINPLNPYQAIMTMTTSSSFPLNINIADGSTFTLGKMVVDGLSTAFYAIYFANSSSTYGVTLNGTELLNQVREAVNGTAISGINFTANNVTASSSVAQGYPMFDFLGVLTSGNIMISSTTIALASPSSATLSDFGIEVDGRASTTVSITNNNITTEAGPSGSNGIITVEDVPNAVITGNTVSITDIPTQHGEADGIDVVSDGNANANNATVSYNTVNDFESGSVASHLILIGTDLSATSSPAYHNVNNAQVYDNILNGSSSNNSTMHGLLVGDELGGTIYNNSIDNVNIGIIDKGGIGGWFHNNIITRATGQYIRAKAASGTLFSNNTAIMSSGFASAGMQADYDPATNIYSSGINFTNNIVYGGVVPTYLSAIDDSTSTASWTANDYYVPSSTAPFRYQSSAYVTTSSWAVAHEPTLVFGDPLFINATSSGGNYGLQSTSPAIDAGANTSGTVDYLGNPVYGAPDIGAYEYQPSYTLATTTPNLMDIGAGARIYSDGSFRNLGIASGIFAHLDITPQSGNFSVYNATATRPAWLDVSNIANWKNTHKTWTESNAATSSMVTDHIVGDLDNNAYYTIAVTNASSSNISGINGTSCGVVNGNTICRANSSGILSFQYGGGYSTHTFDMSEDVSDASLSSLSVSQGTLNPTFTSSTTLYADSVANGVTNMTVTPTATQGTSSTITVNSSTVSSGSASAPLSLNVGANTITIVVTAPDGVTTSIYTITATRAVATYTLSYSAGANGTIVGSSTQTVASGANGTAVTASPATGYHFVDWSDASTTNPRTDSNVTGAISVTANFATTNVLAITSFSLSATSTSLIVPITSFTTGETVAGYFFNESSTTPSSTTLGWTSTVPVSYAFQQAGSSRTLYAWVKDGSGNVSSPASATVSFPYYAMPSGNSVQTLVSSGIVTSTASSVASTTAITFNDSVQVSIGASTVSIPSGTIMTTASTSDFTTIVATTTVTTDNLPSNSGVLGTVQYGLTSSSIALNQLVTITISVDPSYNGQTLPVYQSEDGGITWTQLTTCLITNGICSFTTSNLSSFAVVTPTVTPPSATPGVVVATGGGGSAYDISIDNGVATTTTSSSVTLSLYGTGAYTMELSNTSNFASSTWIPYVTSMPWTLATSTGEQTVFVQYRAVSGSIVGNAQASINLVAPSTLTTISTSGMNIAQMENLLASLEAQLKALESQASSTASFVFTRNLSLRNTGNDVKQLQLFLISQNSGSAARKLAAYGTTNYFGSLTQNALIEFQNKVGIKPAIGYFGSLTRKYINAL